MKPIIIQIGNGLVYYQRPRPDTASQDPYTESEDVIEQLFYENQVLTEQLEKLKKI